MGERRLDPGHTGPRKVFRTLGPILLAAGVLLVVAGVVSFFTAFGGSEPPKYFWCAFLGMPMLFVGGVMTGYGFMGRIARYHAEEMAPVAKDAFNYMAEGTREGVRTMAGAIGQGLSEGGFGSGGSQAKVRCHKCKHVVDDDAKFCDSCGQPLAKSKLCPKCDELNDPDARFCDNCGHQYE
jgi:hypothetical protein